MHTISNRLAALATVLAAVAALAGLAVTGLYVDSPNWVQQAQGTDLATLFLAVPVLALGLWTASRGSSAGRLAVVAGLLYLVYNYAIFAFSVALNPLTAVHIAIFGLSLWSLLLAGRSAVEGAESVTGRLNRRAAGGLLIGVATMFGLLWLGQIATVATTGVLPPDLVKADISSNPVYALDLAFFLPLCAIAGTGLLRRNGAAAFAFPMLVWVPLMGAGVVGGIVLMAAAGDQTAVPVAVAITVLGVVSSILAAVAIVRPRAATGPVRAHHPVPHSREADRHAEGPDFLGVSSRDWRGACRRGRLVASQPANRYGVRQLGCEPSAPPARARGLWALRNRDVRARRTQVGRAAADSSPSGADTGRLSDHRSAWHAV